MILVVVIKLAFLHWNSLTLKYCELWGQLHKILWLFPDSPDNQRISWVLMKISEPSPSPHWLHLCVCVEILLYIFQLKVLTDTAIFPCWEKVFCVSHLPYSVCVNVWYHNSAWWLKNLHLVPTHHWMVERKLKHSFILFTIYLKVMWLIRYITKYSDLIPKSFATHSNQFIQMFYRTYAF